MIEIEMNFDNLYEGQVFKNYKELCAALEIEPATSNSKKAHFKKLNTYCSNHKEGQKIIIDEIYEYRKPYEDGRVGKYPEMRNLILRLLLLSDQEENRVVFPASTLLYKLNAVNINYATGKRLQKELGEHLNICKDLVDDFYESTHANLENALITHLNYLQERRFLFWRNTIMVCKNNSHARINDLGELEIDEEGRIVADITQDFREVTQEEREIILATEKKYLEELGCEKVNDLYRRGLNKTFYKKVYKVVRKRCNISFYFNAYDITFIRSNIEKELERTDLSFVQERNNLNKKVKERVLKNAEDRKETAENGDIRRADVKLRRSEDFIENVNKLIDTVIDMSAKNIVAELKSLNEKNSNKQKKGQHSSI